KMETDTGKCIMIGNDVQEDLAAKRAGIKTYLVEDYIIESEEEEPIIPDWRGNLAELIKYFDKNLTLDEPG
ncbi:MAG: hypothetical protein ACOCQ5_05725, partial [Halanaerobiales bacterium]